MKDEEIEEKAQHLYHNDPMFHAIVYQAMIMAVPNTINESINKALREVATNAAAMALVIKQERTPDEYVVETTEHIYTCYKHGRVITIVQTTGDQPSTNVKCPVMFCEYYLELME